MLRFWLLLLRSCVVISIPFSNLPINAQVPPVARMNQLFTFTFSDSTFTSASTLSYYLTNTPQWLHLDSASRTLSGIPTAINGSAVVLSLIARDVDGWTAMPFTLIISSEEGPRNGLSVEHQLPAYGAFSAPNRILLAPSNPLSILFSSDTFLNTNERTIYYATSIDHTPLPSWIHFDPSTLTFSGVTPQATSPLDRSQTFGIQLSASNVVGFADAMTSFEVVVERHMLAFSDTAIILNVTSGSSLRGTAIGKNLLLDGHPISNSQIHDATASTPPWIHLDPASLELVGSIPNDFRGLNFTVTVADQFGDSASMMVVLQAATSSTAKLLKPIGTLNATLGTDFLYHLGDMVNASVSRLDVDLGSASAWLEFDRSKQDIKGHVPPDLRPQQVVFNITASLGSEVESQILTVAVHQLGNSTSSTTTAHAPTAFNSSSPTMPPGAAGHSKARKSRIAAIVIPVVLIVASALLFGLLWLRCRRSGYLLGLEDSGSSSKRNISRPMVQANTVDSSGSQCQGQKTATKHWSMRLSRPPQLPELLHLPSRLRAARSFGDIVRKPPSVRRFSTHLFNPSRPFSSVPSDFLAIPKELPHRKSSEHIGPAVSPHKAPICKIRKTKREQPAGSLESVGALYGQYVRGFGHGKPDLSRPYGSTMHDKRDPRNFETAFSYGRPIFGVIRKSWKNTRDRHSSDEWQTTDSSTDHDGCTVRQPTIRPVSLASTSSWPNTNMPPTPTKSFHTRKSTTRFMSGSLTKAGRARRNRSRSSSLGLSVRPKSGRALDGSLRFPRVIRVREGMHGNSTRSSLVNSDPRFQSVAPSELGSVEFEYTNDLDREDVQPGLSVAEHRQSSPLTDLAHRFTTLDPAKDDQSAIFGNEGSATTSLSEDLEDVRWMSRGQRLGKQVEMSRGDPTNRSLKGRIETTGSFSTGRAESKRSGSTGISFV